MIIDKLRQSTHEVHKELDTWLFPKFLEINSADKYGEMLRAFYGYFMPVMEMVDEKLDAEFLPDYHERRKPKAILDDLKKIERGKDDIAFAEKIPGIHNASQAFGALYVLEGSSLGGVFLSKIIAQNINIDESSGLSFFYGYGKDSREKWQSFTNHLNVFAANSNHNEEEITTTAIETFHCFKEHLQDKL